MDKSAKLGLWDRIRAKRERGEAPAKPGDKDFPDAKMWKKLTNKPKKQAAANTPCSCGCGDTVATCKCGPDCKCRKPGGSCYNAEKQAKSPAWQRASGKNPEGGLNEKGRKSYERETGGNLKAPVTESNPKGERAKRQNSFCSRMCGMKRVNTGSKAKKDPDSRINKSLRKWNCKCSAAREFAEKLAAGCPNGQCPPGAPPQPPQPPQPPKQYSDVAFSPEYAREAFKQHKIPFNPNASDQMLYKRFTHMGAIKPGAKPNAFQEMVGQRYGGLPPAPPQPDVKTYQPYPPLDPKRGVPQTVKTNAARGFAEKLAAWLSRQG
jgi:hypothetical protein